MEILGENILGTVLGTAIGATIGALFVQYGVKRVTKFSPFYGRCWVTSFFHQIIAILIAVLTNLIFLGVLEFPKAEGLMRHMSRFAFAYDSMLMGWLIILTKFTALFFAQAYITKVIIKYEGNTFLKACKIMAVVWGLILLIIVVLGGPLALAWFIVNK